MHAHSAHTPQTHVGSNLEQISRVVLPRLTSFLLPPTLSSTLLSVLTQGHSKVILWRTPGVSGVSFCISKPFQRRLVLDGGVEGRELTPSCESTGIITNCWTVIDKKTLELAKKDTPYPKTKERPQWYGRRSTITIKSNPITAGWVTHKLENTYTTEIYKSIITNYNYKFQ